MSIIVVHDGLKSFARTELLVFVERLAELQNFVYVILRVKSHHLRSRRGNFMVLQTC